MLSTPLPSPGLATGHEFHLARRGLLGGLGGLLCCSPAMAALTTDLDRREWQAFQARFLAPEGRVVDTGNGGISHSEGQGWGLLFALRADDQPSFERLLVWTRRTLRRPRDELHAWRYQPDAAMPVTDLNNATDGDLCIAWALLDAGERWGKPEYTALGAAIGRDILRLLVRRAGVYSVLLPGARGFDRFESTTINPSYYVFPAFAALARAVPDPAWVRMAADGLVLLRSSRFGRWGLPPDWVVLNKSNGGLSLPTRWPPRFSYDAVRVPLYLAWAGLAAEPALGHARNFWTDPAHRYMPAWADLASNTISPYPAPPGIVAVSRLAALQRSTGPDAAQNLPSVAQAPDYYSAALSLLVRSAWGEALTTAS